MELKNFARAAGYYLFAEALCLFLTLTLAGFDPAELQYRKRR